MTTDSMFMRGCAVVFVCCVAAGFVVDRVAAQSAAQADAEADWSTGSHIRHGKGANPTLNLNPDGAASAIAARGLLASGTLVLIDGRPVGVSGPRGDIIAVIDARQIPRSMVERVEVLSGGASALYGSAPGGVVNIITKKRLQGVSASLVASAPTAFDSTRGSASVAAGTASERAAVSIGVGFGGTTGLDAIKRAYTFGGNYDPRYGHPGFLVLDGGLGERADPACPLLNPPLADQDCSFDFNEHMKLVEPAYKLTVFTRSELELTDHTAVFAEAGYYRLSTRRSQPPSLPLFVGPKIPADHWDNPWRVETIDPSFDDALTPAGGTYVGRVLGGKQLGEIDGMHWPYAINHYRVAAGFRGDLAGVAQDGWLQDWDWELSGTAQQGWGRYERRDVVRANLTDALSRCSARLDQPGVEADPLCFNPFYSGVTGDNGVDATRPVNVNSAQVYDYIFGDSVATASSSMLAVDGTLRGSLLSLPAGELAFALGAQHRHDSADNQLDDLTTSDAFWVITSEAVYDASLDTTSGFAELWWPVYRGTTLQTALRVDHFSRAGTTASPLAGASVLVGKFVASEHPALTGLRLRGSFARGSRAASLREVAGSVSWIEQLLTPELAPQLVRVRLQGTPDLKPEWANNIELGVDWNWSGLALALSYYQYDYTDLIMPQTAESQLESYNEAYREAESQGQDPGAIDPGPYGVVLDPDGFARRLDIGYSNDAKLNVKGIEFMLSYSLDTRDSGAGVFTLGVAGSHTLQFDLEQRRLAGYCPGYKRAATINNDPATPCITHGVGTRNGRTAFDALPALLLDPWLGWNKGAHSLRLTAHFASDYDDDREQPDPNDPQRLIPVVLDGWFGLDVNYSLHVVERLGARTTLSVGMTNMLDRKPGFARTRPFNYDQTMRLNDPVGRSAYLRWDQDFN